MESKLINGMFEIENGAVGAFVRAAPLGLLGSC